MVDCLASFFVISNKFGWHIASRCRFPGLPESVFLDFLDAEPLHVPLLQAEELDEDVSFESFTYDEAEPSAFQRFFLEHPEINIAEFSKAIGLNPSLMRNYINGFKKPSKEREKLILDRIHELGKIYSEVSFAS